MIKINKLKKIKTINEIVNPEIREQVNDVILTTTPLEIPTIKKEAVVPVQEENIVIPEESLPNAIEENPLEETDVESTEEDNKVIAQTVINKRPSSSKKALVETMDVIVQEIKILEQLRKDSNIRMSNLKKTLIEFRRELKGSKIKGGNNL